MQGKTKTSQADNLLFSPLVLTANLVLFLWSEVVLDVEGPANFLRGFALDHVCNCLATSVEEGFNIEIVCGLSSSQRSQYK